MHTFLYLYPHVAFMHTSCTPYTIILMGSEEVNKMEYFSSPFSPSRGKRPVHFTPSLCNDLPCHLPLPDNVLQEDTSMMYKSTHTHKHTHTLTHVRTHTHNISDPSLRTRVTLWLVASSGIQEVRGRHVQQLQLVYR